jgi:AraC family transcriptional regulator
MHNQIKRAVDFIEAHLHEDLKADAPAQEAGMSYYHFNRTFTALTGISPGLYRRRRLLSIAADQLRETRASVINIALDAGFDSHEAFTRAFKIMFGLSPREFRHSQSDYYHLSQPVFDEALLYHIATTAITTLPEERSMNEMIVTGLEKRYKFGDNPLELNKLWQEFNNRYEEIDPDSKCSTAYGICKGFFDGSLPESHFDYIAGIEYHGETIPDEMTTCIIPAATYLVYTHDGPLSSLKETVQFIWGVSLPKLKETPCFPLYFELYDERFNVQTLSGQIEIWIPIKA